MAERLDAIQFSRWGAIWRVFGAKATRSGPKIFSRVIVLVDAFAISGRSLSIALHRARRYSLHVGIYDLTTVRFWPNSPQIAVTNGLSGKRVGVVHLDGVSARDGNEDVHEETLLRPLTSSYAIADDGTWVVMNEGEDLDDAIDRYVNGDDPVGRAGPVESILEEDLEVIALLYQSP